MSSKIDTRKYIEMAVKVMYILSRGRERPNQPTS